MIVSTASALGVDPADLTAATGFDPRCAADPDARITFSLENELWEHAAKLCGEPSFGLRAAELLRPGMFDVIDYAIRTAPSVREALKRLARYNRLEHDVAVFTLIDAGPALRVEHAFRITGATQHRHSAEFTLGAQVVVASQLLGEVARPLRVQFKHATPADTTAHLALFGCVPNFSCAVNALEWPVALVDRALPAADPLLSNVILRHAETLLESLHDARATQVERVRQLLTQRLGQTEVTLDSVAAELKLSARSLQRRLMAEETTFDAVLDELRRDLALRYLADPKLAVGEVAYLLGYSEPSPFHRAFKRWTGSSPSAFRQRTT